jgi:hypothetical protein
MTGSRGRARTTARCPRSQERSPVPLVGATVLQAETKPIGKPPVIAGICCGLRVDGWQPMPWDELNVRTG